MREMLAGVWFVRTQLVSVRSNTNCNKNASRSYEHLAYLQQQWFEKLNCTLRLCYFVAKHGKGIVDTVFATVNRWILEALPLPNSRISTSVELVKECEKGDEFPV